MSRFNGHSNQSQSFEHEDRHRTQPLKTNCNQYRKRYQSCRLRSIAVTLELAYFALIISSTITSTRREINELTSEKLFSILIQIDSRIENDDRYTIALFLWGAKSMAVKGKVNSSRKEKEE